MLLPRPIRTLGYPVSGPHTLPTMTTYVALLRAVNVGGRSVSMQTLRDALDGAGFSSVRTYVQSGNAVFSSTARRADAVADVAEAAITSAAGLDVPVIVRSAAELAQIVASNPFIARGADARGCHVTFVRNRVKAAQLATIDRDRYMPDTFELGRREIYLYMPNGYGKTKLHNAFFEKRLGVIATTRSWNTVTKLAEMTR